MAAVIAFSGTATAADAPALRAERTSTVTTGPAEQRVTFQMTTARVEELVTTTPDHAGNVTVRLVGGRTIPIPAANKDLVMGRAAQQAKTRLESAAEPRPCGSAYITLTEKSNHRPVAMETGFIVAPEKAIGYNWLATIKGPNGYTREYTSRGNLLLRGSWAGGDESEEDQGPGLYTAIVDPGVSHVELLSGDVCIADAKDTARLTVPQAACMDVSQPNSGDGWILNSTEPVDHVIRGDLTSPAGTRAAGAQACLRKNLGAGSPASGEPTGWSDAQEFARVSGHTTGISRCHLIAKQFGGKGQKLDGGQDNLVPCWQVGMNTGTPSMATNETKVKNALTATTTGVDDAVFYVVTPLYKDKDSTIPTHVIMSAWLQKPDRTQTSLFGPETIPNTKGFTGLLNMGN
ncbi:DNA/RNA non-specific endonuclease [Streptomyces sp. bgisy091]|uniref:DNA/RNA non-specific endonuclease n=1 Tax=Streptomyces sp. bgisy091 TaxID=3413778 RepID=UPI003D7654E5